MDSQRRRRTNDDDAIRHHQTRDLISNASITTTSCSFSLAGHRRRSTTDGCCPPWVPRARDFPLPPGPPTLSLSSARLGLPLGAPPPLAVVLLVRRLSVADRALKSVLSADARIKMKETPTAQRTTSTAGPSSRRQVHVRLPVQSNVALSRYHSGALSIAAVRPSLPVCLSNSSSSKTARFGAMVTI